MRGILTVLFPRRTNTSYVTGTGRVTNSIESWRSRIVTVRSITIGENRIYTGSMPASDDVFVPIVISLTAIAPGVVDHIGAHIRIGVGASEVGWSSNPFTAAKQGRVITDSIRTTCASHPLGAWSNTDLVSAAIVANHGSHGMGTMTITIAWDYI